MNYIGITLKILRAHEHTAKCLQCGMRWGHRGLCSECEGVYGGSRER
jgi:hypothetical protein